MLSTLDKVASISKLWPWDYTRSSCCLLHIKGLCTAARRFLVRAFISRSFCLDCWLSAEEKLNQLLSFNSPYVGSGPSLDSRAPGFLCYKLQKLLKPSKDLCQCALIAWCLLFPQLQVETRSLHLLRPSLLFASNMRFLMLLPDHEKILLWHEMILLSNSRSCKCTELKQVTEELMQMNV